jgi:hypothetical protein
MTDHEFVTATSLFFSAFGLVIVGLLFRAYQLDNFREQIFALREEVFLYALDQELLESPAYRDFRALLNGTLRYAHKVTFAHMAVLVLMKRLFNLPLGKEKSPMKNWAKAVEGLCPEQKAEFQRFNVVAAELLVKKIAFTSVFFWVFALCIALPLVVRDRLLTSGQPQMAFEKLKGAIQTSIPLNLLEAEALKAN